MDKKKRHLEIVFMELLIMEWIQ